MTTDTVSPAVIFADVETLDLVEACRRITPKGSLSAWMITASGRTWRAGETLGLFEAVKNSRVIRVMDEADLRRNALEQLEFYGAELDEVRYEERWV